MNNKLFQGIVSLLYWVCNLSIAVSLAFILAIIFLQLSGKTNGFYVNNIAFDNFNKTIFRIPISVDLRESMMDTTVLFRSKEKSIGEPELYQVKKPSDLDDVNYREILQKKNQAILSRYRAGLTYPTDTLTSKKLLYRGKYPNASPLYFDIGNPEKLEGFIQLKVSNMKNGWLVMACNWLEVITKVALWLLIAVWANLLLQDIRKYQIFTADNFRRLRWIGVSLLIMSFTGLIELARGYLLAKEAGYISTDFETYRNQQLVYPSPFKLAINYELHIDFSSFFMALFIIVLAEIFRKGLSLQQEQDLTI